MIGDGGYDERTRENPSGVRAVVGYPGSGPARCGELIGEGAMARTAAGRYLYRARQLEVLLSARHRHPHFHCSDPHLLALRPPLGNSEGMVPSEASSTKGLRQRSRRPNGGCSDMLLGWLVPLAVFALGLGAPARAADEIRVAIFEEARTVEVGGGPMVISDLAGRLLTDDTPTWLRVVPQSGGVEVRSQGAGGVQIQRAASVRLTPVPGGGLRLNGRDYPGVLEVARDAD